MVSFALSVVVVAAAVLCKSSGQEKYQEHLTPAGERTNKCESQQAAGRRHSDVVRCSFHLEVSNFHVQFYPEGTLGKEVPDVHVVVSCSSSCEVPEEFKDYVFINQSTFRSSEDDTYTFEVLPSKKTNGSFMCQAFHKADTLLTDFCNVSDHITRRNLTVVDPSPPGDQKESPKESDSTAASPMLLLLLLLVPVIAVPIAAWKILHILAARRRQDVEQNDSEKMSPDTQSAHELTQTSTQNENEENNHLLYSTAVGEMCRKQRG